MCVCVCGGAGFGVAGLRLGCRAESSSVFCLTTNKAESGLRRNQVVCGPYSWSGLQSKGGFHGGSAVKNPPANEGDAGDAGLIPGLGRFPGGGKGNSLQYSCLGNPMDRGAWWVTACVVTKELDTA